MDVILISSYELGHQPFHVASPAAHLLAEGHTVHCNDLAVERLKEDLVRQADFVGISIPMHTAIRLGVQIAQRVRRLNPACHICLYGLYASLNKEYLLRTCADSIVGGEYEQPLTMLLRYLSGQVDADLSGVGLRNNAFVPFFGRLRFLKPARHLLPPLETYAKLDTGSELKLVGNVAASRGCAHQCLHCPITPVYQGRMRILQQDVVLEDIAQLVEMGAEHITFIDPDFLNGVRHSLQIVERMHERFPQLTFDFTTKIEHILERQTLIPRFKELGCVFILSAVESFNDTILGYLEKGHTRAQVAEALAVTRTAGIALRPTLLPFTPWTDIPDFLDGLDFIAEHDLIYAVEPVQYAIRLLLPPGSSLLDKPYTQPYLGTLDEAGFSWNWQHPDSRVDALQKQIAALVEQSAQVGEDQLVTFYKIRELALSALAGRKLVSVGGVQGPVRSERPPRLTEAWFC